MTEYLSNQFNDSPELVNTFDEVPLWSAAFGLLLLKHLELKPNISVLDVGSGAGFPLLELAQKLGSSCKCYGLDTWTNANERARKKIQNYQISNAEVIDGSAEQIPFPDASIDLIVSNLGINNFSEPKKVMAECRRVLKPGGRLAITTNMNGHWKEFYRVFKASALELGKTALIEKLRKDEEHRGSTESISKLFTDSGFEVARCIEEQFEMKFLDGSAFLSHYFIKLGWLGSWKELMRDDEQVEVFELLEKDLNAYASQNNGLALTVPMLFIEGVV